MSGYPAEEKEAEKVLVVPEEVEKAVVSTDTVKAIFKDRYGRPVEKIVYDSREELWTIDFLMPSEEPEKKPEEAKEP